MEVDQISTKQAGSVKAGPTIVRACDTCRKKKIRCVPTTEGCAQCTKAKVHCHFTPITLKKSPRRPAGFKHIEVLEDRLRQMEGRLENALRKRIVKDVDSLNGEPMPFGLVPLGTGDISHSTNEALNSQVILRGSHESEMRRAKASIAEKVSVIPGLIDINGYSAGASMALEPSPTRTRPSSHPYGGLAVGPFSLPSFQELPAKSLALDLINEAFRSFNDFFPLFDEQDFLQQFHENYLESTPSKPGWWACINVVLSLAYRFRAMRTLESAYATNESCRYMHNALAVVSQLNLMQNSLPAVQALLGMAIVLQGTPHPHTASVLIAAGVRLAQSMGLHRNIQDPSLTEAQMEQRRRVFWVAYFLDRDISLRAGSPFAQDDDDMDVELPKGIISELPLGGDGLYTINFFNSRIGLAVIQGQIYKRLYSVQATRQSAERRSSIAQELNAVLSYWRSGVPIDFEDIPMTPLRAPLTAEFLHMLILRFTYVDCLVMIDRQLLPTEQLQADVNFDMQGAFTSAESLCIIESRKAVRLIQIAPHGDYACIWLLLHPFFAAVTALLHNVVRHPESWQAQSDIHIVKPFLQLLEILGAGKGSCSRSEESKRMHHFCRELNGKAEEAVKPAYVRLAIS